MSKYSLEKALPVLNDIATRWEGGGITIRQLRDELQDLANFVSACECSGQKILHQKIMHETLASLVQDIDEGTLGDAIRGN